MSPIARPLAIQSRKISALSAKLGRRVGVAKLGITDRQGVLDLGPPGGLVSPNGACRMFRAADGWMALNLAREEDRDLVPAWLGCDFGGDPWDLVDAHAPGLTCDHLRDQAMLLSLPACRVGEVTWGEAEPLRLVQTRRWMKAAAAPPTPRVVDLSALWAGPMCGAILAAMGAEVTKVESIRRPDPTRTSAPDFYGRLNGAKAELALNLGAPADQARLREMVLAADVVITSARPRGLASIGLDPDALLEARPGLVWVAVTGYGLWGDWKTDPHSNRVAFGDDAAAAGGLVGWADGRPHFVGDALSDPVTGLAAAVGALRALASGGGQIVDAGMAPMAAAARAMCGEVLAP